MTWLKTILFPQSLLLLFSITALFLLPGSLQPLSALPQTSKAQKAQPQVISEETKQTSLLTALSTYRKEAFVQFKKLRALPQKSPVQKIQFELAAEIAFQAVEQEIAAARKAILSPKEVDLELKQAIKNLEEAQTEVAKLKGTNEIDEKMARYIEALELHKIAWSKKIQSEFKNHKISFALFKKELHDSTQKPAWFQNTDDVLSILDHLIVYEQVDIELQKSSSFQDLRKKFLEELKQAESQQQGSQQQKVEIQEKLHVLDTEEFINHLLFHSF